MWNLESKKKRRSERRRYLSTESGEGEVSISRIPDQWTKLERHRGERFGDQPEHQRAVHPGGAFARYSDEHVPPHDRSFDHQRGGFPGDGHHHNHHFNGEPNDSFGGGGGGFRSIGGGSGHSGPFSGRKRWLNQSACDFNESGAFVKLYVGCVPRTATEEDIRSLFEEHGKILEVVLLKDKRTGQQQECCFVKYATMEEGDRAIKALNNQRILPGGMATIKVRYADGERERLSNCPTLAKGTFEEKLYVGYLNKQASKKEIEEIFSPFGTVEDIFIVRDDMKQSRGCGFVKLSHRDMAVAAINALNGNYVMRGCDQPLIVRFADPKKPRIGEPRGQFAFGGPKFGPRSQESHSWPLPNVADPMGRQFLSNAPYPGSPKSIASSCQVLQSTSGASVQSIPAGSQSQVVSQTANQHATGPIAVQQPLHSLQQSSSREPQQVQTLLEGSQSSKQVVSDAKKQLHILPTPTQNLGQQQNSQVTTQQSPQDRSNPEAVASTSIIPSAVLPLPISASPAVCSSSETPASLDCDWSEHTCPDGYKYYYNCETCESRWEKPEEYTLFLEQLQKHQQLQNLSAQECQSPSDSQVHSTEQNSDTQMVQLQTQLSHQRLLSPSSSSPIGSLSCTSTVSNKSSQFPDVCTTGSCSSEGYPKLHSNKCIVEEA